MFDSTVSSVCIILAISYLILSKLSPNSLACKGLCTRYKSKKNHTNSEGRYAEGQKRCSNCEVFVKWDGVKCPCCNVTLRVKPRNTINRLQLQETQMVKRI